MFAKQLPKYPDFFRRTALWEQLNTQLYAQEPLAAGANAPLFTLSTADSTLHLRDLRGRDVLLHFWASWCPQCRESHERIRAWQLANMAQQDTIWVIHIALDAGTEQRNTEPQAGQIYTYAAQGWEAEVVKKYQVNTLPFLCWLDPQGRIRAYDAPLDTLALPLQ